MNLRRLNFWNTSPGLLAASAGESKPDAMDNVVRLPLKLSVDNPVGLSNDLPAPAESNAPPIFRVPPAAGLMVAPELSAFFSNNYFGLGRHNGSNYKTQEAQIQGKAALVSKFQNAVAKVVGQKQFKVDGLRNMELQTEGVCNTASAQLRLACIRLERDMATLQSQMELSEQGKGWVQAALTDYQNGFNQGVCVAIDAEMLGL